MYRRCNLKGGQELQAVRLRKLRKNNAIREWVNESQLHPKDIILPYFVVEGKGMAIT